MRKINVITENTITVSSSSYLKLLAFRLKDVEFDPDRIAELKREAAEMKISPGVEKFLIERSEACHNKVSKAS